MAKHSVLAASAAERWIPCPGSVTMAAKITPGPGTPSSYRSEGTVAHQVADAFIYDQDADWPVGREVKDVDSVDITVDQEMLDGAMEWRNNIRAITSVCDQWATEQRVKLSKLWTKPDKPPAKMFGTGDFTGHGQGVLWVRDFKYGKGVRVLVDDNAQLWYYGLGAFLGLSARMQKTIRTVNLGIIQPRVTPAVSVQIIPLIDLLMWGNDVLVPAAELAMSGKGHIQTGEWCRWCPVLASCPAQHALATDTAKVDFGVVDSLPPMTDQLTDQHLADILDKADQLKSWLAAVQADASRRIDRGGVIPGWKLVPKRANRKWADIDATQKELSDAGYPLEDFLDSKFKSPAQVEKLVTPEDFQALADGIKRDSTGTTLVRDSDARDATQTGPKADFDAIADSKEGDEIDELLGI